MEAVITTASASLCWHHVHIYQSSTAGFQVYYLHGVKKLLQLLNSDSEEVQHVAAGALRNVVYQSNENKVEVKENDGLALVLNALTNSHDLETRRQLTGQFV